MNTTMDLISWKSHQETATDEMQNICLIKTPMSDVVTAILNYVWIE